MNPCAILGGLSATDTGDGPVLNIKCRQAGSDRYVHRMDLGGMIGNGSTISVQDGDLLQFRSADQTWHPVTALTEDVVTGGVTLHFVNGLYTGHT